MRSKAAADRIADRLSGAGEVEGGRLLQLLSAELARVGSIDLVLVSQLYARLYHLPVNRSQLAVLLSDCVGYDGTDPLRFLEEQVQLERHREAQMETRVSSLVLSLKEVNEIDWDDTFRQVSQLEIQLAKDPADIYRHMDGQTRGPLPDYCRPAGAGNTIRVKFPLLRKRWRWHLPAGMPLHWPLRIMSAVIFSAAAGSIWNRRWRGGRERF